MKLRSLFLLTISLTILVACGGGSDSGGADIVVYENDGVYVGTQTLSFYDPDGELVASDVISFNMSVFENNVTITDLSFLAQAPISENVFIASSGIFTEVGDQVSCDITIIYNGTIGLGSAQGTIQGNSVCGLNSGVGNILNFPLDGTFESLSAVVASKITLINETKFNLSSIAEVIQDSQ